MTVTEPAPVAGAPPGKDGDAAVALTVWNVDPSFGRWKTPNVKLMTQFAPGCPTGASVSGPAVGVNV